MEEGSERLRQLASLKDSRPVEMRLGIVRRTLVFSERMLLCHWEIKSGTHFGEHSHLYEQAGFVLRGRLKMIIDGIEHELGPGSSYLVPSNVKHDAVALEDVEVVDVFAPLREEYVD